MIDQPLVSIIIPTYNRAHLIGETLDSVLAQTYTNWECIVVDDGSTDGISELMDNYCSKDSRFQYHHRPADRLPGGNAARNYGFEISNGEYINWLDSDDILVLNKINAQILAILENNGEVATCNWGRFKELINPDLKNNLNIYKDYNFGVDLIRDYGEFNEFFPSHVFLVKKSNLLRSGLWNENLKINQDGEFFCRLLIVSKKICFVKSTNVLYRNQLEGKTSIVTNKTKAEHMILSWLLIDNYLKLIDPHSFENYIQRGKNYCFLKLNKEYFNLLKKHKLFFKRQFQSRQLINRIKRKLF